MANAWLTEGLPLDQLASPAGALDNLGGPPGGGGGGVSFTTTIGHIADRPAVGLTSIGDVFYSDDEDGIVRYENITGLAWSQTSPGSALTAEAARSALRVSLATLLATPGTKVGQRAFLTDYGLGSGLIMEWLPAAVWGLPAFEQPFFIAHVDASCGADTTEDTLANGGTLPSGIWRPNDKIRLVSSWFQSGVSTNAKTAKVKVAGTNIISQNIASATKAAWVHSYELRFRNALNSQMGGPTNFDVYGQIANDSTTHAIDFTANAAVLFTGTKALSTEVLTLHYAGILVQGRG